MDIRTHLETLANGDGKRIVDGIRQEVEIVTTFMKDFSIPADKLKPETRIHWMQSLNSIQTAEKYASTLDRHLKKAQDLENKKPVRDILRLQEAMRASRSPVEYGKLNRQLKQLKDMNARDLSDLVSNQHQALLTRINLVNRWKSLLAVEIRVLEECKSYVLQFAKSAAESSGDAEFLDEVIRQIHLLQGGAEDLTGYNVNISALQTANILVLRKTVKHQLDEVVKLEKIIEEKRVALSSLSKIAKRLEEDLPDDLKPKPIEVIPTASHNEDSADVSRPPPDSDASEAKTRMAFQDKDKR